MTTRENLGLFIDKITRPKIIAVFILLVSVLLYFTGYVYESIIFITIPTATILVNYLLKIMFRVDRPKNALVKVNNYSLPSGHAAGSMALAVISSFILLINSVPGAIFYIIAMFAIAFFIGFSRLFIRVHTGYQVYIGFLVGFAIPILILGVLASM